MESLIIPEQDIINAICLDVAKKTQIPPETVEVELFYDDEQEETFTGKATIDGQAYSLQTIHIIEALRLWLEEIIHTNPNRGIQLQLDDEEGIVALIH